MKYLALTILLVALAACGASKPPSHAAAVDTTPSAGPSPTTTVVTATSQTPTVPPCTSGDFLAAGQCTVDGGAVTLRTARRGHDLQLPSLSVIVDDVRTRHAFLSSFGTQATAAGLYVVVTVTVHNRMSTPQTFDGIDSGQVMLDLQGSVYSEAFDAENGNDARSFISRANTPIEPGEDATGDVIFDVPPSRALRVTHAATDVLAVGNFGEDIAHDGLRSSDGLLSLGH